MAAPDTPATIAPERVDEGAPLPSLPSHVPASGAVVPQGAVRKSLRLRPQRATAVVAASSTPQLAGRKRKQRSPVNLDAPSDNHSKAQGQREKSVVPEAIAAARQLVEREMSEDGVAVLVVRGLPALPDTTCDHVATENTQPTFQKTGGVLPPWPPQRRFDAVRVPASLSSTNSRPAVGRVCPRLVYGAGQGQPLSLEELLGTEIRSKLGWSVSSSIIP